MSKDQTTSKGARQNKNSLLSSLQPRLQGLQDYAIGALCSARSVEHAEPASMMIVMSLIFSLTSFVFQFDALTPTPSTCSRSVFFTIFQDGTNGSLKSIIDAAPLIKKIYVANHLPHREVFFSISFCFSLIAAHAGPSLFGMIPSWKLILVPVLFAAARSLHSRNEATSSQPSPSFFRDVDTCFGAC